MAFGVFLAVLGAAFLHALWNALIKVGDSKIGGMLILSVAEIPIGIIVLLVAPPIDRAAAIWVLGSGCAHFGYMFFLTYAYERGDLSRVYPIARGLAPMLVTVAGIFLLDDRMTGLQYGAIVALALGILLMAAGVFTSGENRRLLPFAIGSAIATATYTMVDGMGARVSGSAVAYVGWIFIANGVMFAPAMVALHGWRIVPRRPADWGRGSIASVASYGAYAVSVWAMTLAPIALVEALRETSILFAVLIGWLVFGERMSAGKALAAVIIVFGVVLTRL